MPPVPRELLFLPIRLAVGGRWLRWDFISTQHSYLNHIVNEKKKGAEDQPAISSPIDLLPVVRPDEIGQQLTQLLGDLVADTVMCPSCGSAREGAVTRPGHGEPHAFSAPFPKPPEAVDLKGPP